MSSCLWWSCCRLILCRRGILRACAQRWLVYRVGYCLMSEMCRGRPPCTGRSPLPARQSKPLPHTRSRTGLLPVQERSFTCIPHPALCWRRLGGCLRTYPASYHPVRCQHHITRIPHCTHTRAHPLPHTRGRCVRACRAVLGGGGKGGHTYAHAHAREQGRQTFISRRVRAFS